MEDGIGDSRVGADVAEFADAFDTGRIHVVVNLGQHDDLNLVDIGINGDVVVLQVAIDVSCVAGVHFGGLQECRTHPPYQTTHELTARGPRVHNAPGGEGSAQPRH